LDTYAHQVWRIQPPVEGQGNARTECHADPECNNKENYVAYKAKKNTQPVKKNVQPV
jgi:hypothetical protein